MRLVSALVIASAVSLSESAGAQIPPPRDAANPETRVGTAVVRGRVTDAETGAPLSRVTVSLSLQVTRAVRETTSDANGAFEFTRVAAGDYSLTADPTARRTTHRPATYGAIAGKAFGKRSIITLQDGQVFEKADMALARSFVISGRVFDEEGEPVADALVKAEAMDGRAGSRSRTTDDRGGFRLWGYTPGAYKVCAAPLSAGPDVRATEGFIQTCYPSTPESEAQPLIITSTDPPEIEIRLRRSRLFRISGVVLDGSGAIATNARVQFVTVDGNGVSSRGSRSEGGAFAFRGIAPGEYFIKADIGNAYDPDDKTHQTGYAAVNVQSTDVENLVIAMSPPATVRGRIVFEGSAPPGTPSLTVQPIALRGSIAVTAGSASSSPVNPDLSFELRGLVGPHIVQVNGLREWIVKSVKYRGEERHNMPTEFKTHSDPAALEIVLTNRAARLIARVLDEKGQPTEDARVVVFPADSRQWDAMNVLRFGVRREGAYEVAGLRSEEYFVAVVPDGMTFGNNRRSMEELSKQANRTTVLENDQRIIDLTIRR